MAMRLIVYIFVSFQLLKFRFRLKLRPDELILIFPCNQDDLIKLASFILGNKLMYLAIFLSDKNMLKYCIKHKYKVDKNLIRYYYFNFNRGVYEHSFYRYEFCYYFFENIINKNKDLIDSAIYNSIILLRDFDSIVQVTTCYKPDNISFTMGILTKRMDITKYLFDNGARPTYSSLVTLLDCSNTVFIQNVI
jgi:hypothetical protein